jgi:hypothetical protein
MKGLLNMKRGLLYAWSTGALLLFAPLFLSADYPGKEPPAGAAKTSVSAADSKADLLAKKQELIRKRQQSKARLIRSDLRLRRLRNQILRLAKELTLEVDSKPEIRSINEEIQAVDRLLQK